MMRKKSKFIRCMVGLLGVFCSMQIFAQEPTNNHPSTKIPYHWRAFFQADTVEQAFLEQKAKIQDRIFDQLAREQPSKGIQLKGTRVLIEGYFQPELLSVARLFPVMTGMIEADPDIVPNFVRELFERGMDSKDLVRINDLANKDQSLSAFVNAQIGAFFEQYHPDLAFLLEDERAKTTPSTQGQLKQFLDLYLDQRKQWCDQFTLSFLEELEPRSQRVLISYLYERVAPNTGIYVTLNDYSMEDVELYRKMMNYPLQEEQP